MRTITYYSVLDGGEGVGDRIFELASFEFKKEAEKFAKGRGSYGEDLDVSERILHLYETAEEKVGDDNILKIQAALAKLTKEERKLLGIKYE